MLQITNDSVVSIMTLLLSFLFLSQGKVVPLLRTAVSFVMCSSMHQSTVRTQCQTQLTVKLFYSVWVCRGWTVPWYLCILQKYKSSMTSKLRGFFFSVFVHEFNTDFMEVIRKFNWKFRSTSLRKKKVIYIQSVFMLYIPCSAGVTCCLTAVFAAAVSVQVHIYTF